MLSTASLKYLARLDADLARLSKTVSGLVASLAIPGPAPKMPDVIHMYSQAAMDARQFPVLALFNPLGAERVLVAAADVRAVALANGYEARGYGGLFTSLLRYADDERTVVEITPAGVTRFAEIKARAEVKAA